MAELCNTIADQVNEVDSRGLTALAWAVKCGSLDSITQLLTCGADPNISDVQGRSPTHLAAAAGLDECIELLAAWGARLYLRDRFGDDPLHYASTFGRISTVDCLLNLGVDIESTNSYGETAITCANGAGQGDMVRLLIERGQCLVHVDTWGLTPVLDAVFTNSHNALKVYFSLERPQADVLLPDGRSVLHIAAQNSDRRTMELLLEVDLQGLDAKLFDSAGNTAMDYFLQRNDSPDLLGVFSALLARVESTNVPQHCQGEAGDLPFLNAENDDKFFDVYE